MAMIWQPQQEGLTSLSLGRGGLCHPIQEIQWVIWIKGKV